VRDRRTWSKHLEVFTSQALMDLLSKAYLPITSLPRRQDHLSIIKSIHEQTPALAEGLGSRMACAWSGGLARRMPPAHTSSFCSAEAAVIAQRAIARPLRPRCVASGARLRVKRVGQRSGCDQAKWGPHLATCAGGQTGV
jgi:hypothetical protein